MQCFSVYSFLLKVASFPVGFELGMFLWYPETRLPLKDSSISEKAYNGPVGAEFR